MNATVYRTAINTMNIEGIRQRIRDHHDGLDLLEALPSHETMKWMNIPAHAFPNQQPNPPTALVIGIHKGRLILACLVWHGDKPREVRYCSKAVGASLHMESMQSHTQDEVVRLTLDSPFKYVADPSKVGKREFSIVVRYYFLLQGLLVDGFGSDLNDYSKRFYDALNRIDAGRKSERGIRGIPGSPTGNLHRPATVNNDSSEPEEPRTLRNGPRHPVDRAEAASALPPTQLATPAETLPSDTDSNEESDYNRLRSYLTSHNALYLLDNIPAATSQDFVPQSFLPTARPQKLFIGRHTRNPDEEIYAYMRPSRKWHDINFWVQDHKRPLHIYQMRTEEVAKQRLVHPFNKTFPKDGAGIDQGDRARFTLMVKFYFVESGVAGDVVLKETKAFPERLKSALEYVARRMGGAAVRPPPLAANPRLGSSNGITATREPTQDSVTPIDENDIQTTLTLNTSPAQTQQTRINTTPACRSHSPPTQSYTSPLPDIPKAPQTTPKPSLPPQPHFKLPLKRTASEAHFSSLAATVGQAQLFTTQLNAIDEQLSVHDIEKMAFEERLEEQRQAFMSSWDEKRKKMVDRRMEVKKQEIGAIERAKRISKTWVEEEPGSVYGDGEEQEQR